MQSTILTGLLHVPILGPIVLLMQKASASLLSLKGVEGSPSGPGALLRFSNCSSLVISAFVGEIMFTSHSGFGLSLLNGVAWIPAS